MALFMTPEVSAKWAARQPAALRWRARRPEAYRHGCAALAAGSIAVLMAGNLTGFVIGVDGLKALMGMLLSRDGAQVAVAAMVAFFSAAQARAPSSAQMALV